jgi:hypothetical protein
MADLPPTNASEQPRSGSVVEKQELAIWLESEAGLTSKKLAVAIKACEDGMVESLNDLRTLYRGGELGKLFPTMLVLLVREALEREQKEIARKSRSKECSEKGTESTADAFIFRPALSPKSQQLSQTHSIKLERKRATTVNHSSDALDSRIAKRNHNEEAVGRGGEVKAALHEEPISPVGKHSFVDLSWSTQHVLSFLSAVGVSRETLWLVERKEVNGVLLSLLATDRYEDGLGALLIHDTFARARIRVAAGR